MFRLTSSVKQHLARGGLRVRILPSSMVGGIGIGGQTRTILSSFPDHPLLAEPITSPHGLVDMRLVNEWDPVQARSVSHDELVRHMRELERRTEALERESGSRKGMEAARMNGDEGRRVGMDAFDRVENVRLRL
ncbi:hypothetical protein HKX48_002983 [Thoreauomyces humboldtii]|nr:hypothetical protein HKX48_002983 [Thoreauomyces humboldtii]